MKNEEFIPLDGKAGGYLNTSNNTVIIPLTKGKETIIDAEDYPLVKNYKWHADCGKYTCYASVNHNKGQLRLHRLILGLDCHNNDKRITDNDKRITDHKDRNGLNNRRENIRVATYSQNNSYSRPQGKYKGVYKANKGGRKYYYTRYEINNKIYRKGSYPNPEYAAMAYDLLALKYSGQFAYQNFSNIPIEEKQEYAKHTIFHIRHGDKPRGVSFFRATKKWKARITYRCKVEYLGYFDDIEEAAKAYDRAAIKYYGEKAKLNFPREEYE